MYDVVIVGAGPARLFSTYKLIENNPKLKILLLDKGKFASNRICPMKKTGKCVNCNPCGILSGYGGAGNIVVAAATATGLIVSRDILRS